MLKQMPNKSSQINVNYDDLKKQLLQNKQKVVMSNTSQQIVIQESIRKKQIQIQGQKGQDIKAYTTQPQSAVSSAKERPDSGSGQQRHVRPNVSAENVRRKVKEVVNNEDIILMGRTATDQFGNNQQKLYSSQKQLTNVNKPDTF